MREFKEAKLNKEKTKMENEKINVSRVGKSKFGHYLMDNDEKFTSSTEQVNNFLSKQVPCTIEIEERQDVEGKKGVVTRVKVLEKVKSIADGHLQQPIQQAIPDNSNEMEQPVETVKPGIEPASNYKPSPNFYETQDKRQESIVNQFCTREGLQMIRVMNEMTKDDKIIPTMKNIYNNAQIVKEVLKALSKEEFPDY